MFRISLINASAAQQELAAQAANRLRQVELSLDADLHHVDAVWIAGPVAERAAAISHAARSKKPMLVEMPAADSISAMERLHRECAATGVKLMVASPLRFRPSIVAVKHALDSGKLGQTALLRVHGWQSKTVAQPDGIGSLIVRSLDLAVWMLGCLPSEVFTLGSAPADKDQAWPDYVQIHLGCSHGGMALLTLSTGLPEGDGYESLSVVGSTGAAYADEHSQTQLLYRGGPPFAVKASEDLMATTALLREFVSAVSENREPNGGDERTALRLAELARQSLSTGQPVRVPEVRDVGNR